MEGEVGTGTERQTVSAFDCVREEFYVSFPGVSVVEKIKATSS